jgi:hypothetical protein
MRHARIAPLMGLGMGAAMPLMIHGPLASAGAGFVLLHLAAAGPLAAGALLRPRLRAGLLRHGRMAPRAALGAAAGFALVCTHCLATWHGGMG